MDELFNLEFQFKSVFNLKFQPKFGIQLGIPISMAINLGECSAPLRCLTITFSSIIHLLIRACRPKWDIEISRKEGGYWKMKWAYYRY